MQRIVATAVCLAPLLHFTGALSNEAQAQRGSARDEYYDLGGFHQPVTTSSRSAQRWFDRGLAMCYGFNHEEGVRCFQRAIRADAGFAMGYWGLAYAWGPNINNMEILPGQIAEASLATRLARQHSAAAQPWERALIDALARRYAVPVPDNREPLNRAYAAAMEQVYEAYGDSDPLFATLYAEALMNLQPWMHWSPAGEPGQETPRIVQVLEDALERWPNYAALCHLYIHTMEASPEPARALPAANRLRGLMPGLGHLVHMPTHIDVLVGNYEEVIRSNLAAIVADTAFVRRAGRNNFYTYYRIHNYHFVAYGAMFDGQSGLALQFARELVEQVPEEMLREQTDFLDAFMPMPMHVLVRFGRWEEILREPEPADFLPASRCVWHYARALAYAATDRVALAKTEQDAFLAARAAVPETSFLFQNSSLSILSVAESMLAGEIAYRERKYNVAFDHLREAVRRDDSLNYDEPWAWMQPARHALGALLLEQGMLQESETVFRADLERHPRNPWALHGLAESLARQGKGEEASRWRREYDQAVRRADVKIDRSCFCRVGD